MNTPILFEVFVPMVAIRVEVVRTSELKQLRTLLRDTDNPADLLTVERADASDWFTRDFQSAITMPHSKPL